MRVHEVIISLACILPLLQTYSVNRFSSPNNQLRRFIGSEVLFADQKFLDSTVCQSSGCQIAGKSLKANLNATVDPCDDFYEFACGGWVASHTIADDQVLSFGDVALEDAINEKIRDALTTKRSSSDAKVIVYATDLYKSCLDKGTREATGVAPVKNYLHSIIGDWPLASAKFDAKKFDWKEALPKMIAELSVSPIFSIGIGADANDTKVNRFYFDTAQLGLGENQLLQQDQYPQIIKAYKKFILETAMILGAKNDSNTRKAVDEIVAFETKLAEELDSDDSSDWYNRLSFKQLNNLTGETVDWLKLTNKIYETLNSSLRLTSDEPIIVGNPDFYQAIPDLIESTPKRVIANYFGWVIASSLGPYTVNAFKKAAFEFDHVMTGAVKDTELWKDCLDIVSGYLQYAASRLYVDKSFSKEDKKQASVIVNDIKESFDDLLKESDWLDATTKKRALTKLDDIHQNVGYPDWILNNTELDAYYNLTKKVDPKNFIGNILYITTQGNILGFNGLREPVDISKSWPMAPHIVNAAYEPTQNSITIPAGQLSPPYFDVKSPPAINYGAIGAVVGHELTHGFDDDGSQFDENGNLRNWWTDSIYEKFDEKAECFIEEYSSYVDPQAKLHLNGNNTVGENIADNGGIRESFRAYQKNIQKKGKQERLPVIDKYTAEQQFFISYASTWCTKYRTEYLGQMIQYNPHSPAKYRVNVPLSNFQIFSQAFKCSANSKMNRKDKCVLW